MATAFTLTGLDRTAITSIGGDPLILTGTFSPGSLYLASLTDTTPGHAANVALCLSGIVASPLVLKPLGSTIYCWTPKLADGTTSVSFKLMAVDGTAATPVPMSVVPPFYDSHVFTLRAFLPPIYRAGARTVATLGEFGY